MIENYDLLNELDLYYKELKSSADCQAHELEEQLLKKADYQELYYSLNGVSIDYERALFNNDDEVAASLNEKKEDLNKKLQSLRKKYLQKLSPTKTAYFCNVCKDSSYTEKGHCICYYKNLTRLAYRALEVKPLANNAVIDLLFNKKLGEKLKGYCDRFNSSSKNLILTGEAGTGKTYAAQSIANYLNEKPINALFLSIFQLNDIFISYFDIPLREQKICKDVLATCDLLIIDDLGSEPILNKVTVENLLAIISERVVRKKPFIITTNLTPNEIGIRYEERILSRISGKDTVYIAFKGKDERK